MKSTINYLLIKNELINLNRVTTVIKHSTFIWNMIPKTFKLFLVENGTDPRVNYFHLINSFRETETSILEPNLLRHRAGKFGILIVVYLSIFGCCALQMLSKSTNVYFFFIFCTFSFFSVCKGNRWESCV